MRRNLFALATAFALAAGVPGQARASDFSTLEERMSAADFQRAGLEKLSAEELAHLNAWLQSQGLVQQPAAQGASAPNARAAEDRIGFHPRDVAAREGEVNRIESQIEGRFTGWRGAGDLITLANGQVWRVTDSSTRLHVQLDDPRVTIERGLLGGWQLRVEGYNTRARVTRVQ